MLLWSHEQVKHQFLLNDLSSTRVSIVPFTKLMVLDSNGKCIFIYYQCAIEAVSKIATAVVEKSINTGSELEFRHAHTW